ncbi:MAG: hypothetical protein J6V09_07240 [Clostridia bacterium]|nr:hypothetical protein [Clostridia bacterium]
MKKIFMLLLALSLTLCLFACGGSTPCTHADGDGDGVCDKCDEPFGEKPPLDDLLLVEDGEGTFNIVLTSGTVPSKVYDALNKLKNELHKIDIKTSIVRENDEKKMQEIEVLVGNVTTRGEEYDFDAYELGNKGYVVKRVKNKVIIDAVTEKSLLTAIEKFRTEILGLPTKETPETVAMNSDKDILVVQDDYAVTALKVNGADMKGYTIATDTLDAVYSEAARWLQTEMFDRTGYYFKIVGLEDATDMSIVIKPILKTEHGNFKVYTSNGGRLVIECAYLNKIDSGVKDFFNETVFTKTGAINFTGTMVNRDVSTVTYEEYGAKGDGITDDFAAIYKAHVEANAGGQHVYATPGKTYLLRSNLVDGEYVTIPIMTNVTWTGANFIIDDTNLSVWKENDYKTYERHVFTVVSDKPMWTLDVESQLEAIATAGINRDTTVIDIPGVNYPAMLIPYNSSHKVYRRLGQSYNVAGQAMQEVIVIDKDGKVSADTPIIFDYKHLDSIDIFPLNIEPITIEGGHFTTKACRVSILGEDGKTFVTSYYNRGIDIRRSFTTMRGVTHYVEGEFNLQEQAEGKIGPAYHGFYSAHDATDILYENCTFAARRCYRQNIAKYASNGYTNWGSGGATGTYAHNAWNVNNLTYRNFNQSNFWITVDPQGNVHAANKDDPGAQSSMFFAQVFSYGSNYNEDDINQIKRYQIFWGSGGTNFCKNVVMDASTFSRFDAHSGMWNGKIINGSTFHTIALTGGGDLLVEHATHYAEFYKASNNSLFGMRSDYGSTWEGSVKFKNVDSYVYTRDPDTTDTHTWDGVFVAGHGYSNWYFGYICYFPSIELDNVNFFDIETNEPLAAGYEIKLVCTDENVNTKMHLKESHVAANYEVADRNNDGYVDMPDLDEDGILEATKYLYADYKDKKYFKSNDYHNVNPVCPPEYIRIFNNDGVNGAGGYVFTLDSTASSGYISNGGYYGVAENNGGFFGSTSFEYTDASGNKKSFYGPFAELAAGSCFEFKK